MRKRTLVALLSLVCGLCTDCPDLCVLSLGVMGRSCSVIVVFLDIFNTFFSQRMTKPTTWHVRLAKTQISLGIRPV